MEYSIGQVSDVTGVSVDALRYYERIGLLPGVRRNGGGQRRYADSDLARLRFIRRAQSMDFTLDEIGLLLQLRDSPGDIREEVRGLTEQKLEAIDARIRELTQLRGELASLVEQCRASDGCCPIIQHMAGGES